MNCLSEREAHVAVTGGCSHGAGAETWIGEMVGEMLPYQSDVLKLPFRRYLAVSYTFPDLAVKELMDATQCLARPDTSQAGGRSLSNRGSGAHSRFQQRQTLEPLAQAVP